MNVGGLKLNSVIAHALVPREDGQTVFHAFEQSFATSVQSVRFCRRYMASNIHTRLGMQSR